MTAPHADAPPGGVAQRTTKDLAKAAVSGWLGTALEFMDFQLYSLAAALVFKDIFFPSDAPGMAIILAMATYATGYLSRPLGAWYFGRLGDRVGRTKVLFYTIALMGIATTAIGLLPTYHQVGILAPILLVVLRLAQGFGAGAEIAGSSVMLTEYAPRRNRGLVGSLVALGTNSGTLGASAIWGVLVATLSTQAVIEWGWRIPFIASSLIMLFAVWLRRNLKESPVFEGRADVVDGEALSREQLDEAAKHDNVLAEAMHERKGRAFFEGFFLRFGQAGNSGMVQTYLISYITAVLLLAPSVGTGVVITSSLVGFVTVPFIGWLSDKVGRKLMYIVMSSIALLLAGPMIYMIATKNVNSVFAGYIIIHQTSVLALASLENNTMSELFGARARLTQLALAKELAAIVATGIGPVVAAALVVGTGGSWWPIAIMIGFFSICSLGAAIVMPETAGRDLTVLNDARPGEAIIGPFARKERARLGLPAPEEVRVN
ncbi:MFS transporter [Micropruina glycogenica]|uniref:Putative transporter n=1 Tax=Micropruina glycogenica TaxID=75385 RepID=A0A2N9JLE5_9ACTN|nr:MFS transporter [Micropruina glycogenica]SPD88411.1 putative transporter [Micropruina glycogenica]